MPKLSIQLRTILYRFLLFSALFILVSGITGPWVISTRLLYGFNFFIYGNLGKMVIISIIIFGILIRERLNDMEKLPKVQTNILFIVVSFLLIPVFFLSGSKLLHFKSFLTNVPLSLLTHGILILIPALLLMGIFGRLFLTSFSKRFNKEIAFCLGISILYDFAIFQVWKLWPFFSFGVLTSVTFLLSLTFRNVQHFPPYTLIVNDFGVSIQQACSGLDSLFMFSALYILIGIIDYKKFNLFKFVCFYFPAAVGMYLVNILRVYILIVIGAVISPELSLNLFHTYAGMILFIIYFGLFWKLAYKKIMKN